jgi:hypothetical protein
MCFTMACLCSSVRLSFLTLHFHFFFFGIVCLWIICSEIFAISHKRKSTSLDLAQIFCLLRFCARRCPPALVLSARRKVCHSPYVHAASRSVFLLPLTFPPPTQRFARLGGVLLKRLSKGSLALTQEGLCCAHHHCLCVCTSTGVSDCACICRCTEQQ